MEKINASPYIVSITPSDATIYSPPLKGVRCGVTGNIAVRSNQQNITITNVQVGEHLPGDISQVLATGTTATEIIGWQWET